MIEDWRSEMDLSPEKIHRLIVNHNMNIMNLGKFKEWLNIKYEACKAYGDPEEIGVYEEIIEKFNEIFEYE